MLLTSHHKISCAVLLLIILCGLELSNLYNRTSKFQEVMKPPTIPEYSHATFKARSVEVVPDLLNPGKFLKPKMTPAAMETSFIDWIQQIHYNCSDIRRIGNIGDGGWDVCFDPPFHMPPNNCLVYSFGIRQEDHNRSDLIGFHNLGLTGPKNSSDLFARQDPKLNSHREWKMDTLSGIRTTLGHKNELIDYLKIDIERSELYALPSMFQDGDLWTVKQLGFELHIGSSYKNLKELGQIYLQLLQLELIGFHRFHYDANRHCNTRSKFTGNLVTRCHEIYYVNNNFFNKVKN